MPQSSITILVIIIYTLLWSLSWVNKLHKRLVYLPYHIFAVLSNQLTRTKLQMEGDFKTLGTMQKKLPRLHQHYDWRYLTRMTQSYHWEHSAGTSGKASPAVPCPIAPDFGTGPLGLLHPPPLEPIPPWGKAHLTVARRTDQQMGQQHKDSSALNLTDGRVNAETPAR